MAVQLIDDVPDSTGLRPLGRAVAVLVGAVLVALGLLLAIVPLVMLELVVVALVGGSDEDVSLPTDAIVYLALFGVGAWLCLWVGLRLIRGRRRMGLYLRKFGFAETTRTVSRALSSAVGRSVRLVTLDDAEVTPLGTRRSSRWLSAVLAIVAIAVLSWVVYQLFGGPLAETTQEATAQQSGDGTLSGAIAAVIGEVIALIVVWIVVVVGLTVLGTGALLVGMLGGGAFLAARRAERGATRSLDREAALGREATRLARASRRIFAPRLVVVAVPNAFWQKAVHALADNSDVVVIDVSFPTEPLIWEVGAMKRTFQGRWVLVGARDLVAGLTTPGIASVASPAGRLAALLDGEQILVYGPGTADQRRFTQALHRRLRQLRRAA